MNPELTKNSRLSTRITPSKVISSTLFTSSKVSDWVFFDITAQRIKL